MLEPDHFFGLGDKPSKKKTKSNAPYFEPPVPLPPNLKKFPEPTSEDKKKFAQVEQMEKQLALSAKLDTLARTADEAQSYFSLEAGKGSLEAAEYLFWTAYKSIQSLYTIYSQNPKLVRQLARQQIVWPAFVSTHNDFNKTTTSYISGLELGQESGLKLKRTRWTLKGNPYSKAAYNLHKRIKEIHRIASHVKNLSKLKNRRAKLLMHELRHSLKDDVNFLDSISKLGSLTKHNLPQFKPVLKKMYLLRFPHPEDLEDFKAVKTYSKIKSASQAREKIIEMIMQRLASLLASPSKGIEKG